jgi:hypothetical protein
MFSFVLRWVLKFLTLQINRHNTVYVKVMVHFVCCVWNSLELVLGSECAAGGFVVSVCWHCVVVSRGILIAAVLKPFVIFMKLYLDVCNLRSKFLY